MSEIIIYQKNWAFTTGDSKKPEIRTGSFGPCFVVTFTAESKGRKYAAMAHIDDVTNVDSMETIFKEFIKNSVALKDVKVVILGGWEEHFESKKWGDKIVKKINQSGFESVSTKNMYLKKVITKVQYLTGVSKSDNINHYHYGARVDATTGKTYLSQEEQPLFMKNEQIRQVKEFAKKHGTIDADIEVPLTQIN